MSKPKAIPVPEAQEKHQRRNDNESNAIQEPLSGSKKVKNHNHVSHLNKEG
ncbi:small acid-soluble spore protein P [Paenibacillus glacialis]|uniref:Spore protein n=1 Tax=Paenibacillus glacialis TaxID=494026 RepID=A0A162K695_9BACL|nr:small acid-soluble spore protein P [Paenibacillus glacialis]OAB43616.1 spore protein [Paenibacillus glacialis]